MTIDQFKKIAALSRDRLCLFKDGEMYVANGTKISSDLVIQLRSGPRENGIYSIGEYTCGGSCSIGHPQQKCRESGAICQSCAKYDPYHRKSVDVSIERMLELIEDNSPVTT